LSLIQEILISLEACQNRLVQSKPWKFTFNQACQGLEREKKRGRYRNREKTIVI
jgi:hypothetical protein